MPITYETKEMVSGMNWCVAQRNVGWKRGQKNHGVPELNNFYVNYKARGREDSDGNERETTGGLRDEAEEAGMVPWPEEGYLGEIPHPIYDEDDALR